MPKYGAEFGIQIKDKLVNRYLKAPAREATLFVAATAGMALLAGKVRLESSTGSGRDKNEDRRRAKQKEGKKEHEDKYADKASGTQDSTGTGSGSGKESDKDKSK
ncbi:MAG TPA: hypothetical protein VLF93_01195 [Candidatus Saccharimonadales bacterium]|nr:hypothetical protein [Candidatus Saccharimonadales bacterium]